MGNFGGIPLFFFFTPLAFFILNRDHRHWIVALNSLYGNDKPQAYIAETGS